MRRQSGENRDKLGKKVTEWVRDRGKEDRGDVEWHCVK